MERNVLIQVNFSLLVLLIAFSQNFVRTVSSSSTSKGCMSIICEVDSVTQGNTSVLIALAYYDNSVAILDPTIADNHKSLIKRVDIPKIKRIAGLKVDPVNGNFLLTDSSRIYEQKNSSTLDVLVDKTKYGEIVAIDVDATGGNLYWADKKYVVNVMSLATKRRLELIKVEGEICDISVVSAYGVLLVAVRNYRGMAIEVYHLDGSKKLTRYLKCTQKCIKLAYVDNGVLLWSESGKASRKLDALRVHHDGELMWEKPIDLPGDKGHFTSGFVKNEGLTLLMDAINLNLHIFRHATIQGLPISRHSHFSLSTIFNKNVHPSTPMGLEIFKDNQASSSAALYSHTCGNQSCSHLCFPVSEKLKNPTTMSYKCVCSIEYNLASDGKACVWDEVRASQIQMKNSGVGATGSAVISIGVIFILMTGAGGAYILWTERNKKMSLIEL